ncbi:MAG: chitobiase/beta-hexosaminidase C-terminal domain-containing protein [Saprospiraceae bacterium]|nr:chitobiase/beta-hexosaminidase C-terminal domain-containing protein [Saprospiraceae bacterium]
MVKSFFGIITLLLSVQLSAQGIPLAQPRFDCKGVFFQTETEVGLEFDMDGAKVFYTINGSKPKLYKRPFKINKTSRLYAFASHPDFGRGDTASLTLQKVKLKPVSLNLKTNPNPEYKAMGANSLIDFEAGGNDLHDGKWVGFLSDSVVLEAVFPEKTPLNTVTVSVLNNPGAWVLPMRKISVYTAVEEGGNWLAAGSWMPEVGRGASSQIRWFPEVQVKRRVTRVKLVIDSFGPLPSGHPGAGNPAWLFLDEILFN